MRVQRSEPAAPGAVRDLSALFDPRSVAVVGASSDESKYGNWLSVQALRMSGTRAVHLVNRGGGRVLGQRVARSLAEVAGVVDLVAVAVPAPGFEDAVDESLRAGARAIVGVTAGFAEMGEQGRAVQERIVAKVRAAGAVLVGPNCLGVSDASTGLTLTSNPMPRGRVAMLSQSGNLALEIAALLAARGHGFSRFVSLGNQADLGLADLLRSCARDPGSDVIAVYCEDFLDGRAFVEAATEAAAAGKPVLLLTVGGSDASRRGARSHTGSLTSDAAVVAAACEAAGVLRVRTPRQLVDTASLLLGTDVGPVGRIAIVADGGGHASVAADLAEQAGVRVPGLSPILQQRLAAVVRTPARLQNPIDIGGTSGLDFTAYAALADTLLDSDEVDAVLVTGYFGGYEHYGESLAGQEQRTVRRLAASARRRGKAILVHTMFPEGRAARALTSTGVPVFADVGDAAACLGILHRRRAPRPLAEQASAADPPVSEDGYWSARALVARLGIPVTPGRPVADAPEAVAAADEVGYPVALKALGLDHKTDVGGVALDLADADELRDALRRMRLRTAATTYSVEAMADTGAGVELIVGCRWDPRFGPVVMAGLGGVLAEVLADVTFALAPLDAGTALEMLRRLRTAALLGDFRGRAAVDLASAAAAVVAIGDFCAAHPEVSDLEINPLLVTPTGVVALDARTATTRSSVAAPA